MKGTIFVKPNIERVEKALTPYLIIQDGRKCISQTNIDAAIATITKKFTGVFCEVSPHKTFPVFTFKVSSAKIIYFEAVAI